MKSPTKVNFHFSIKALGRRKFRYEINEEAEDIYTRQPCKYVTSNDGCFHGSNIQSINGYVSTVIVGCMFRL